MRTYARIDRRRLAENYLEIRRAVGPRVAIVSVIKGDAYGHGAVEVARALAAAGADCFAVAYLDEAVLLREAGVKEKILLLTGPPQGEEAEVQAQGLTPMLHTRAQLEAWEKQARRSERDLPYHLGLDTGMTRLGFDTASTDDLAALIGDASDLRLEGLATHLAAAEDFSNPQTGEQLRRFDAVVEKLEQRGVRPRYVHVSNSAAIAYRPDTHRNMVRPGLALYGYVNPAVGSAVEPRIRTAPVLEWKARILLVRDAPAGARLGYSGTYTAERPMRIGVLSVGYGDGLSRRMSNGGEVMVRGKRCPIVGLVSMDLTLVDLSAAPAAEPGEEVTLIGESIDARHMARQCGNISYEVLCNISKRVPRVYCG